MSDRAVKSAAKPLLEPATGKRLAALKQHDLAHVKEAVRMAREAQAAWALTPLRERQAHARKMGRAIVERVDAIAEIVSRSTGKTRIDALSTDVFPGALMASYYARIAPRVLNPRRLGRSSILFFNKVSHLTRVPFGVIGIISPWNYPFGIPLHEVIPALLAGNGVILKVATQVQPVGEAIAEVVKAAGFPEGLFSLVHLPGGPGRGCDARLRHRQDFLYGIHGYRQGIDGQGCKETRARRHGARRQRPDDRAGRREPGPGRGRCALGGMSNAGQSCSRR